ITHFVETAFLCIIIPIGAAVFQHPEFRGPPAAVASCFARRGTVFERYSEKSRRIIFFARYEASQLGARAIEPEHILLAIIREDARLLDSVLPQDRHSAAIRDTIQTTMRHDPKLTDSVDLPLSSATKRI